ncbi:S-layer homology domain-containing protein [Tumebacillus flagellatus]|uniref:SLH domain-containing protein n=1 Tax=Tumebacillus flagellatus TaxID=1157490 RepID=A0A074LM46_9BACL|nr:S-layer homology domain-containing protein [Tumebacillus flagellatus]KEO82169.1 hypothetical protein EL26_16665 [Tumebacillus flagellatus]
MKARIPALLLTGTLLASLFATPGAEAQTPALKDLGASYAQTEIQALVSAGIISGYEDNTFRPAATMTRQEFATLLSKALKLTPNAAASAKFTDVESWAQPYVGALVTAGLTSGTSATTFGANEPITREQLAAFFIRAMGRANEATSYGLTSTFSDENAASPYAKPLIALTQHIGFIKGSQDGNGAWTFDPQGNAERQAVARLAYEFYTHRDTYTSKIDTIGRTISLLDGTDAAMNKITSFHMSESMNAPDTAMTAEGDYVQSPLSVHQSGSITSTDTSGQKATDPMEFYIAGGTEYIKAPDNTWYKQTFQGNLEDIIPSYNNGAKNSHYLAPFLTVTDNGDTYTLSGTLPGAVMKKALLDQSGQLPAGSEDLGDTVYRIVLDKNTLYQKSVHTETTFGATYKSTFDLTLSNYNNVAPITVPANVKNSAQSTS